MNQRFKICRNGFQKVKKKPNLKIIQSGEDVDLIGQKIFCKDVNTLCQPLSKLFGVTYFSHTRAFHEGQFVSLMTNPELIEHFLKRKLPISFSEGKGFYLNSGLYLSDCHAPSFGVKEKLKTLWDEFRVGHMISIIKKNADYDDMYSFGINEKDENFVNKFLNNLEMIEHFILYFKGQTCSVLNKIELVSYSKDYFLKTQKKIEIVCAKEKEDFLGQLPLKKIQVLGNLGEKFLSQREYQCLHYASKCYSLKEIAQYMKLSPRTVETYLNSVKNKLGVEKRSDLVMFAA